MISTKFARYLKYGLVGVLYAILLTPVLVSSKYLFPFITTKTMYFRLLTEAAIFMYFWLALLDKNYRPKMNLLAWLVVIFGAVIFLTGLTGVNFYKTFWGTIERGEGFLTVSHLIIYFLILFWTFREKKEWLNYFSGALIVGFLVEFYAFLQQISAEKFLWFKVIQSGVGRLTATIGNAAFLGAYTLQMFYLSLFLFFERREKGWKIFSVLMGIFSLLILYHTQTRGAILALVATLPILAILFIFARGNVGEKRWVVSKKIRKIFSAVLVLIVLLVGFVWLSKNSSWVKKQPTLNRLVEISKNDITTQSRFMAWDSSFKGWKDRFLLGYGWENYNIAFNKYFHPEIFMDQGSQLWFDRAHNTIFDVAVATGLVGLLVYLSIFGAAFKDLWRAGKIGFFGPRIFLAALLAHFLQNVFVFDVLSTYVVMFMIFAYVCFLAGGQKAVEEKNNNDDLQIVPAAIVLVILIFAAYVFNIKPLKANLRAVDALWAVAENKEQTAVNIFKEAIDMGTYQTPELRQKLADNIIGNNTSQNQLTNDQITKNYELTVSELKKNIAAAPEDVQNYLYLMAILNRGMAYNSGYLQEVLNWGEKAIPLSPTRPQTYFELGQAYVGLKKIDQAIEAFKKGVELNPETMESRWNLFAVYIVAGKDDLAKEQYDFMASRKYDFNALENLQRLYKIYAVAGRTDKVVQVLEVIVNKYPTGDNYAKLAAAYAQIGEKEKARAAVEKAVELNPNLATEAQKFLEMLK